MTDEVPYRMSLPRLLGGRPDRLSGWLADDPARTVRLCLVTIFVGAGSFGAVLGWWRAPLQALYVAIKFPLILLLSLTGNALLNGMLAPLLGVDLRFRQSLLANLVCFAILSAILGAFASVLAFLVWNSPPLDAGADVTLPYTVIQLAGVGIIAFAGVTANVQLLKLLEHWGRDRRAARRLLFSWLAGNLLLGSQLTWNLRPFMGAPHLPVEFLRPNAFEGNFFETVFHALARLL
jgi:hypothetical protein